MKNTYRLTILLLFTLIIAACGKVATVSVTPPTTIPTIKYTQTPTASDTPLPSSHPPTLSAISIKTATVTPSITPTETFTVSPTATPDNGVEILHTFTEGIVIGWYPEIIVNNPSDFWIFQPNQILHFQEGINDIQIPINGVAEHTLGFEISPEKTIWFFDVGEWPQPWSIIRLLQIDEHGTLLTEYILPKSILVDASGNYIEDDPALWWEPDGSLILGGDNYIYQLLDQSKNLNVQRRSGYRTDSHEYNVLNYYGTQDQPALISIDSKTIPISSNYDALILTNGVDWGFLGARQNGDFYVKVYEYNTENIRITSQRIGIRKYDVEGNLVKELVLLEKEEIPNWDKEIPSWKFPIVTIGRDGELYAFMLGNKNSADRLVRIRID
ncbi:MAG: hypothetical protein JXB18_07135 [Sedimentisphaerales bacterium]|nr:hypothetical protein [Sedimentisphaerales bacterium]